VLLLQQAAEKLGTGGAQFEKHPSGAEARIDFAAFAARLKSRPDTELTTLGVVPQPVKPALICGFCGATKADTAREKEPAGSR
jgi:hypothetical protein